MEKNVPVKTKGNKGKLLKLYLMEEFVLLLTENN